MAESPDLRVSDADRERTADLLRRHAGEGRLDPEELDERLTRAYAARTAGELAELTSDLPDGVLRDDSAARPSFPRGKWLGPLLFPPLVCTLIWLATGAHAPFWPIWVFLGVGIAALAKGLGVDDHKDRPRDRGLPRPPEPPEPPKVSPPR